MPAHRRVLGLAAGTRLLYLAIILGCSRIFEPYDTSSQLVADGCTSLQQDPLLPTRLGAISKLQVWDVIFYSRIASCGYEYEQYHAFFPLAPKLIGTVASLLFGGFHQQDGYILAALLINNAAFCATIVLFYQLSVHITRSQHLALTACVFYCLTPASVFHAMAYTEALFGLFTTLGLYLLHCRGSIAGAALAFAASAGIRSNGIISYGFILHLSLRRALAAAGRGQRTAVAWHCVRALPAAVVIAAPYAAFQYFGFLRYCRGQQAPRPWCSAVLPSLYSFVQSHYWGVGLLRYYQMSQLGNFLLAAPVLLLSVAGVVEYAQADLRRFLTGGLLPGSTPAAGDKGDKQQQQQQQQEDVLQGKEQQPRQQQVLIRGKQGQQHSSVGYCSQEVAVYVFQWAFLACVAALAMHVQVATRFLSTCPQLYWFMAHLWLHRRSSWLWTYSFVYMMLGALLFPNFYPWT